MVRTVEAPFIRRVAKERAESGDYWKDERYQALRAELLKTEGEPVGHSSIGPRGT